MNFDIRCLLTWPQLSTIYVHEFDEKHGKLFKQINSPGVLGRFLGFVRVQGFLSGLHWFSLNDMSLGLGVVNGSR